MTARPRDFLVEIGTEELPPLTLAELSDAFAGGMTRGLAQLRLAHGAISQFATPRRLAVLVAGLSTSQPDQQIRRRGPPVAAAFDAEGRPTRAAAAFAESCGARVESLARVREGKNEYLLFEGTQTGEATIRLLPGIVTAALDALPIAKRMRWGSGDAEFVRPVQWVVLLFGKEVVPATILGIVSGNQSRGHRFHGPHAITISEPAKYAPLLKDRGHVIASYAERRERIRNGALAAAGHAGRRPVLSDDLLDEVTALVEWPVPLVGTFEPRYLELPREVLVATLQDQQRYFPIEDRDGALTASFVAVSNIESREPARVVSGNERVVRPRLADATFFWDSDRKRPLASRLESLKGVTFQAKLGSMYDKSERTIMLARAVAAAIRAEDAPVARAAELAKCDLVTRMVGEFPELQGIMGGYYARLDGESPAVAQAIAEQYLPRFAGDKLPASKAGVALAIADKLDTICGVFAIGQKPSGARDPFGVRRAALGVLRIAIELALDIDLKELIARSAQAQPVKGASPAEIYDYMIERLRAYYLEGSAIAGMTTEIFDAVLVNQPASPLDFDARVRALAEFQHLPEAPSLTAANKRIANILKQAADAPVTSFKDIDPALFEKEEERRLFAVLVESQTKVGALLLERRYAEAMQRLATLRAPVDGFFDAVMVMDERPQVRAQRLGLLSTLRELFMRTADLSRLGG